MAMTLDTPAGTLEITHQYEEMANGSGIVIDAIYRVSGARFISNDGEKYLDCSGVYRFLNRTGWPPVPNGGIGQLMTNVLPPCALSTSVEPGIEMWRLSDVETWRAELMMRGKLTDPAALAAIRSWLARPWQAIHSAALHDRLEELGRETVFDLWDTGEKCSVAVYGEKTADSLKSLFKIGQAKGFQWKRTENRRLIAFVRLCLKRLLKQYLYYEGEAEGHREENGGPGKLSLDSG